MKLRKCFLMFLSFMFVGSNVFVYAGETTGPAVQNESIQDEEESQSLAEIYHKAGLDSPEVIINVLLSLGISEEDIAQAAAQGKKIYDILQEEEVTMKKFKSALNKEYKSRIKEARKFNLINRKEARILRQLLKERMDSWEV